MTTPNENVVTITTKNTPALTMGIIAIVLGVLSLLVSWIPFIGLLAIPVAVIGMFLAFIGLILAAIKGFRGWSMPLLGGIICTITVFVSLSSTGGTSAAISTALNESNKAAAAKSEAEEASKKNYISSHLVLGDIEAKYRDSLLDGKVPGVLFTIKNTGTRSLKRVKVMCYFLDSAGARIAEESFLPVSEVNFQGAKILKPGYTWTMEANRFFAAKSVPNTWKTGKVDLEITEIEFTNEKS